MHKNKKAFTLVELIVSISIMTFILSVVLYNYGNFNDKLALSSAAQELSVAIRQAQAYGINVKESAVNSNQFNYAYGIYFSNQTPTVYNLYVDSNTNNKYDGGAERVETISFRNGVTVNNICNSTTCPAPGVTTMAVNFLRPNPDARIYFIDSGGNFVPSIPTPLSYGSIQLRSPKGTYAYVIIESTGQVVVQ